MYKHLIALICIATFTSALPHSFGETLPCGTAPTTYEFLGSSLTIQCDVNATFSLSLYASIQTGFSSSNIKSVTVGVAASVGFNLSVTPATTTVLQATFVTPSVSLTSQTDLESNFDAGCLQYDSQTKTYNEINIDSYNYTTKAITVNFPEAGTYVFIAFNSNAFLPAWYNRNHTVPAGSHKKLEYPSGLFVELYSQDENVLSVSYNTNNPTTVTPSGLVVDYFFVFKAETEDRINATIKYVYNKTEAVKQAVNQSALHWVFYNETSKVWETVAGGYVDVQAGVVVQVTPHFSTWAVSDASESSSTTGTTSGMTTASSTTDSAAGNVNVNFVLLAVLSVICKMIL